MRICCWIWAHLRLWEVVRGKYGDCQWVAYLTNRSRCKVIVLPPQQQQPPHPSTSSTSSPLNLLLVSLSTSTTPHTELCKGGAASWGNIDLEGNINNSRGILTALQNITNSGGILSKEKVPQGSFGPFHPTEVVLDLKSEFFDIFQVICWAENMRICCWIRAHLRSWEVAELVSMETVIPHQ